MRPKQKGALQRPFSVGVINLDYWRDTSFHRPFSTTVMVMSFTP